MAKKDVSTLRQRTKGAHYNKSHLAPRRTRGYTRSQKAKNRTSATYALEQLRALEGRYTTDDALRIQDLAHVQQRAMPSTLQHATRRLTIDGGVSFMRNSGCRLALRNGHSFVSRKIPIQKELDTAFPKHDLERT